MLFYRARLDGPPEVLDVSLSPVRPVRRTRGWLAAGNWQGSGLGQVAGSGDVPRLGEEAGDGCGAGRGLGAGGGRGTVLGQVTGFRGRVRVVLRYGQAAGPVRIHRGWLHTDLPPGRRLRLAGFQVDGEDVLLSLAPLPDGAGRERLRDRFRLPFHLNSWGVEAVTGVRAELFCMPSVRPGALLLRGRGVVVLAAPAARLVRAVPFCRWVAADLTTHLDWRARAAVEGVEVRVGPGGAIEGSLHVAVTCWGEPGPVQAVPWAGPLGRTTAGPGAMVPEAGAPGVAGIGGADRSDEGAAAPVRFEPAAVRRVDAAVKRLEAEVVSDGLALVSGMVELDVAWADRSGRGRWTCREVPFSALLSLAGLCAGDRLEPVAQVERLARAGKGADERAFLLVGVGLTALRAVHLELGGAWYRVERLVGQAAATVELNEPLFPRDSQPAAAASEPSRKLELETGLHAPWTALRARIRRAGGRAVLEVVAEPYRDGLAQAPEAVGGGLAPASGAGLALAVERVGPYLGEPGLASDRTDSSGDRPAPAAARLELSGDPGAVLSLASVGPRAAVRARRPPQDGGVEVGMPRGTAVAAWHRLPAPARWVVDVMPQPGGVACLVRCDGHLRRVDLRGDGDVPAAVTVAGTAVPGAGMDRLWVEMVNA